MRKLVLIFGSTGQDGSLLLNDIDDHHYSVLAVKRPTSNTWRWKHLKIDPCVVVGDITDNIFVNNLIADTKPDYIYNLAAHSFVGTSWDMPHEVMAVNGIGLVNILSAVLRHSPNSRVFHASTSEMFGNVLDLNDLIDGRKLTLEDPMHPVSPYGAAKLYAHHMCQIYRDRGVNVTTAVMFNHESKYRGEEFVTMKIARRVKGAMDIYPRKAFVQLGNMQVMRDWGHAQDFVEAMQQVIGSNKDCLFATGKAHTISYFVKQCAIQYRAITGHDVPDPETYGMADAYVRPSELYYLQGDPTDLTEIIERPPLGVEAIAAEMMRFVIKGE